MSFGRYTLGSVGSWAASSAANAGIVGIAIGSGKDYLGKVGDGITAVPRFVTNYVNIGEDLRRLGVIHDSLEKVGTGMSQSGSGLNQTGNEIAIALDYLRNLQIGNAISALQKGIEGIRQGAEGAGQSYKGGEQIINLLGELDLNRIYTAAENLGDNVFKHPSETVAAAATLYAAGWALSNGIKLCAGRGEGSLVDRLERKIGEDLFPGHFDNRCMEYLGKAGYRGRKICEKYLENLGEVGADVCAGILRKRGYKVEKPATSGPSLQSGYPQDSSESYGRNSNPNPPLW